MAHLSVVSPVYGCADCLRSLHRRIVAAAEVITDDFEIVFVDDRSPDDAWEVLRALASADHRVRAVRLSRNFGQHAAITAGLAESMGDWTVVLDCDLQDPPEAIGDLYARALEGYQVVLCRRSSRKGSRWRRATGDAYYRLLNLITPGAEIYTNYTNLSMLSRQAVEAFLTLRDKDRQYLLIVNWIGFERAEIEVATGDRTAGRSSYGWRQLVRVATDGIFFSTTRLLRWIVLTGLVIACLGLALAAYTTVKYALGGHVADFAGVSVVVLVMSGFIIFSTGVSGLYVGKIFEQVKSRPLYVVDRAITCGAEAASTAALGDVRVDESLRP